MAARVFFHIGLPKTGTTYLQSILWANREQLAAGGMLLPGLDRRDHLWASCVVRGDPKVGRRHPRAETAWERLVSDVAAWPGDAVISHEFFCSASAEQAAAAVSELAPAEVHLVITARDTLGLFVSSWQEAIKNKETVTLDDYCAETSENPVVVWNWRALDLGLVLQRWGSVVPAQHVHVLPVAPANTGGEDLWDRFATLVGLTTEAIDVSQGFQNRSMGVVETETLRRINGRLEGFERAIDRGVWVRSFLADERLVPRAGEKFWPSPEQVADCRSRGRRAVELIRERGFDVVGRPDDLLTPEELPERRHPGTVTDAEVADVAMDLVATLLEDVRRLTREVRTLTKQAKQAKEPEPEPPRRGWSALLRGRG